MNKSIQSLDDENYLKAKEFFKQNRWKALTYDDITLATHHSKVLPNNTDPTSNLTERIQLSTPFVSADMDTVTEHEMAIQMALNGGIWFLHSNLSPEEQIKQVGKVKHHVNWIIREPIFINEKMSIGEIISMREDKWYNFSTFPVLDESWKLKGLLGWKSVKERYSNSWVMDMMLPLEDIHHVTEQELWNDPIKYADSFFNKNKWINKLLIVDNNGEFKWLITESDISKIQAEKNSAIKPTRDNEHGLRVGVTLHIFRDKEWNLDKDRIIEYVTKLVEKWIDIVAVSTAHGFTEWVGEMVKLVRSEFKDLDIIAWNVTSAGWVEFLREAWANAIKIWQWPGSICTTRTQTGVWIPQMTALYVCSEAAKILWWDTKIIADWWITKSWDMVKALTLADTVMLGWLLAWSDESPWEIVTIGGKTHKTYRWMWSVEAMKAGSAARYGQKTARLSQPGTNPPAYLSPACCRCLEKLPA